MNETLEQIESSSEILEEVVNENWGLTEIKTVVSNLTETQAIKELSETISIWEKYLKLFLDYLWTMWPKIVWAILILWIWFKIINFLNRLLKKSFEKANIDPMVKTFSLSMIWIILKIFVILTAAGMVGIQTTSFVALFTAAWVAIWMSLSGTLQNFAWWIIILAFRLYKIWDFVSIWTNSGTVKSIHIFHTIIITPDKKTIIIPNSQISNWAMTNFSTENIRRVDINLWVDYNSDIELVKKVFMEVLENEPRVVKTEDYKSNIFINDFLDSSIQITIRFFVESDNLHPTRWEINERLLDTCRKNNINIPFPKRDIIINNK